MVPQMFDLCVILGLLIGVPWAIHSKGPRQLFIS